MNRGLAAALLLCQNKGKGLGLPRSGLGAAAEGGLGSCCPPARGNLLYGSGNSNQASVTT